MLPQGWATLVAMLDGHPDADPITRAQRLCELCVEATGASGVSLAIRSEEAQSLVCATDEVSDQLEQLQLTLSEGPCVDAVRTGRTVQVADLSDGAMSRWPLYAGEAVRAGAHAVFAVPVQVGTIRLGVLSLYRSTPGRLSEAQLRDVWVLAEAASLLLTVGTEADAAEAFLWAVGDRSRFHVEVYQAIGALTVQLGVSSQTAFSRLRAHAFATSRPIAEVSADIMSKTLTLKSH